MTIEHQRTPKDNIDVMALANEISEEFNTQGLTLEVDMNFGGLGKEYFGFNVDDGRVNLGFLQIIFHSNGWEAIVPQNELGKRSATALCNALGQDTEKMELTPITIRYGMYRAFFPIKK